MIHPQPVAWRQGWDTHIRKPTAMAILTTKHLEYRVGEKIIVDDVSLSVERGEVLCLLGPSGSGKSSFLRLLNRLTEPTSGSVRLEDQDYREFPPGSCGGGWGW